MKKSKYLLAKQPIIKFNGGLGAILCHECGVIAKQNLSEDECQGKVNLLYCKDCCNQQLQSLNKQLLLRQNMYNDHRRHNIRGKWVQVSFVDRMKLFHSIELINKNITFFEQQLNFHV